MNFKYFYDTNRQHCIGIKLSNVSKSIVMEDIMNKNFYFKNNGLDISINNIALSIKSNTQDFNFVISSNDRNSLVDAEVKFIDAYSKRYPNSIF